VGAKKEVAVTGGVAANRGLVSILEEEIGHGVLIPPTPELAGAIGAALIAKENMMQGAS
jgi:(R)-2-hydroxyacyl-CoA dehydratese activating ATPase